MKRLFAALLLSMGLLVPGAAFAQSQPTPTSVVVVDCALGYHVQPGTTSCVPNDLSASATTGNAPLSVSFSSGYPGTVDFGDGSTGGLNPAPTCASCAARYFVSHVYTASGSYTARLQNVSGGTTVTISVGGLTQKPRPTCRIIALQNSPGVGATVNISWASTNATGGTITTIGSVGPSGTQGVIPLAPATTYVGSFTGAGGTGTCSITIAVLSTGGYGVTGSIGDVGAVPEVGDGLFYVPTYDGTAPAPITTPKPPTTLGGPGGPGSTLNTSGGLVSCGGAGDCNICTLSSTVQNLLNFALGLSIPIAAGMFAYAGWLYFSNAESEDKIKRAKRIFRDTLIGFCIALMAWLAVQTILKALAPGYSGWNSFQCNNLARPLNSDLNQVLTGDVGAPQQAPLAPVTVYNYNGTAQSVVVCQTGSSYSQLAQNCVNGDGEITAPLSDTPIANGGCPDGSTLKGYSCEVCYGGGTTDTGATIPPDYCEDVPPISASNTDCSASNIINAASQGGYTLTSAQANTLSCIAVPESACGRNTSTATTPGGQVTSATGMFQIVMGYNDTCHNLNIGACTQAAQSAGYQVSGDLNCSQHFRGGVPIDQVGQACKAAASNINCNASAAACLVQKNPTYSDWTADPRSSAQQRCVQQYNG